MSGSHDNEIRLWHDEEMWHRAVIEGTAIEGRKPSRRPSTYLNRKKTQR